MSQWVAACLLFQLSPLHRLLVTPSCKCFARPAVTHAVQMATDGEDSEKASNEALGQILQSIQEKISKKVEEKKSGKGFGKRAVTSLAQSKEIKEDVKKIGEVKKSMKTKTDRFELQFTCDECGGTNRHSISRHAYTKGTVLVRCPHCASHHIIADNLNWIENNFRTLEEEMEKKGTPVKKVVKDGAAALATAAAFQRLPQKPASSRIGGLEGEEDAEKIPRIDGITAEQALRIRKAFQKDRYD